MRKRYRRGAGRAWPLAALLLLLPLRMPAAGLDGLWPGEWLVPRPVGDGGGGGWWAATGGGRPYGLPALAVRRLALGHAGRRTAARLRWRLTGSDTLWREDAADLLCLAGRRRPVGFRLTVERGSSLPAGWSASLVTGWRGERWWVVGCWPLLAGGPPGDRLLAAAGTRRHRTSLAAAAWSGGDLPAVAVALWWHPVPRVALGVRGDPGTGELGILLAVRRGGTVVRLAWLLHPALGTSRFGDVAWGMPRGGP